MASAGEGDHDMPPNNQPSSYFTFAAHYIPTFGWGTPTPSRPVDPPRVRNTASGRPPTTNGIRPGHGVESNRRKANVPSFYDPPSLPQQHPSQNASASGSNPPPPQQCHGQNASASGSNPPPPQQRHGQNASTSGSNPPPPQQRHGQNASASGSNPPPPQQRHGQNTSTSGSNPPPPQQRHGQNASTSGSNPPPPQQRHGQNASASGSNPPPPQQRHGQNASASGSNPPPPQQRHGQNASASGSNPPLNSSIPARALRLLRVPTLLPILAVLNLRWLPPGSQRRRKNNGSAKKRARATGWKIFRDDVPGAAVGLQKACHLHLRILMRLLSQSAVPIRLTADEMAPFEARFRSAEDVDVQLADILAAAIPPSNAIYEHVAAFLRSAEALSSQTAADARKVGDDNLRSMFSCVANAGLHSFTPDVFGNPESMYNLAHEHVAIHSFRNVVMRHGYSALYPVNLSLIHDDHLIQRFYRSFVYGHMKLQAGKEERRPGQLEIDIVLNNTYRRRDEFKTTRGLQIKAECFLNPHVAALAAETECHSDDEELPDRTSYLVHEKPGRDGAVSALFEIMTHRREATMAQKSRKGTWRPRTRRRELPPSDLSHALPTRVPIDYFSPDFFNALSVRDRASYMHNGIALPTEEHCRTWEAILRWKSLPMADFMTHYGTAKLALYNLPTDEELALLSDDD
ncbi:hypothetical protein B0H19DRAFT_1273898 [Mycena capillaripes]|nr:hypothetical protein B0H19DRAFT_1273898 [Mycena capillaripes]